MVCNLKKILIIGSAGAGKSTFAKKLKEFLNLPVFHLDNMFWQPNWIHVSRSKLIQKIQKVVKKSEWILDGNYSSTLDIRISYSDTIIFLNYTRIICLWRAIKRNIIYRNKNRSDITDGCFERINSDFFQFLKWIWDFPIRSRPQILYILKKWKKKKFIIILNSPHQAKRFLKILKNHSSFL